MIKERKEYDLNQALVHGRCPYWRCHGYLTLAPNGVDATCMNRMCDDNDDWPKADVNDAFLAWRRRKGLVTA